MIVCGVGLVLRRNFVLARRFTVLLHQDGALQQGLSIPFVAFVTNVVLTFALDCNLFAYVLKSLCKISAAIPAICGAAMEVPLMVAEAFAPPIHADLMLEPGAKISTHAPMLEKSESRSKIVVDPTVMAFAARAGE